MKPLKHLFVSLFIFSGLSFAFGGSSIPAKCELSSEDIQFIQEALSSWEKVSTEYLKVDSNPLPWMILFDTSCVWHLSPDVKELTAAKQVSSPFVFKQQVVPLWSEPHDSKVHLPNGSEIPAKGRAFASLYHDGNYPFFVFSLLDVWRLDSSASADPNLEDLMLGVLTHEIVHTRQLVLVNKKIEALQKQNHLPEDIDDDIIEHRFKAAKGFSELHEKECNLFYQAAAEVDKGKSRLILQNALNVARERRARFFKGEDEAYAPLEDIFLNMEGVAVWAAYKLTQAEKRSHQLHGFERSKNSWSQDEGLALFLLIERMSKEDWRNRVLTGELVSPFTLLEEAMQYEQHKPDSYKMMPSSSGVEFLYVQIEGNLHDLSEMAACQDMHCDLSFRR